MTREQFDDALHELLLILCERGAPDEDDALSLRLAELRIARSALTVTRQRNKQTGAEVATLAAAELGSQIAWLAHDILGYYAMPHEPTGTNEPPVGTATDRRLRSLFLEGLQQDETRILRLKDDLANFLARIER